MSDKEVRVREYTRRVRQREPEDGTGIEFPSIAPTKGVKIVDAKSPTNAQGIDRGVKRVGGGDHGKIEKGVKRLGY